jgi:Fe-S-cluster-containing dehydrogenase component
MSLGRREFLGLVGATGTTLAVGRGAQAREPRKPKRDAYGLLYDGTRCIGCKACVVGCADANGLERETHDRLHMDPIDVTGDTKNVIKLYKEGDKQSFVKKQCMHCVDPGCISACMMGAFHKAEHDIVAWNGDACIGCRYCMIACPFQVPRIQWFEPFPVIQKCELCRHRLPEGKLPGCVEVCPRAAVIFGTREQLLADAKDRIQRQPHRYNPKVYGEVEVGGTQCLYLMARGIDFDEVGLPNLGTDPIPTVSETIQHGIYQGFIAPSVLFVALGAVVFRNKRAQAKEEKGGEG